MGGQCSKMDIAPRRVIHLESEEECDKAVSENVDSLCIFYFYARWCPGCGKVDRFYHEISDKYKNVQFYKIDVERKELQGLVLKLCVDVLPHFIFVYNGAKVERLEGVNEPRILDLVQHYQTKSMTKVQQLSLSALANGVKDVKDRTTPIPSSPNLLAKSSSVGSLVKGVGGQPVPQENSTPLAKTNSTGSLVLGGTMRVGVPNNDHAPSPSQVGTKFFSSSPVDLASESKQSDGSGCGRDLSALLRPVAIKTNSSLSAGNNAENVPVQGSKDDSPSLLGSSLVRSKIKIEEVSSDED